MHLVTRGTTSYPTCTWIVGLHTNYGMKCADGSTISLPVASNDELMMLQLCYDAADDFQCQTIVGYTLCLVSWLVMLMSYLSTVSNIIGHCHTAMF
jgi:hypothetical protein